MKILSKCFYTYYQANNSQSLNLNSLRFPDISTAFITTSLGYDRFTKFSSFVYPIKSCPSIHSPNASSAKQQILYLYPSKSKRPFASLIASNRHLTARVAPIYFFLAFIGLANYLLNFSRVTASLKSFSI